MAVEGSDNSNMLRTVFDAMPSLIFVVDDDVRVQDYNAAAAELLSNNRETILKRRGGDVLNCIRSKDVPEGCGRSPFCNNCVIRNSVNEAFQGNNVVRRRSKIEIIRGEDKLEIYALITASPFLFKNRPLVLLVIEDISEIAELQRMIPICSICKKIRDEKETWSRVEAYFKEHWDVDFSHGLCPKCYEHEMEAIEKELSVKSGASLDS
jgi:transcriptional regulator with PAS, ATPase and Fis domain